MASYKVLNDLTVEITTSEVNALLPFQMAWIVMSSPAQWQTVGKSWDAFIKAPSGTGPFKLVEWRKGDAIIMERFADYYGGSPAIPPVAEAPAPAAV